MQRGLARLEYATEGHDHHYLLIMSNELKRLRQIIEDVVEHFDRNVPDEIFGEDDRDRVYRLFDEVLDQRKELVLRSS